MTEKIAGFLVDLTQEQISAAVQYYHRCKKSLLEDIWILIDIDKIDKTLFNEPREDIKEERLRETIQEAFKMAECNPRYTLPFEVMTPSMYEDKPIKVQIGEAYLRGEEPCDWAHQALEWAFRITNGESWENICKEVDRSTYSRMIFDKKGLLTYWGGSIKHLAYQPETTESMFLFPYSYDFTPHSVLKRVRYPKKQK